LGILEVKNLEEVFEFFWDGVSERNEQLDEEGFRRNFEGG
jgi:hypothetical protein